MTVTRTAYLSHYTSFLNSKTRTSIRQTPAMFLLYLPFATVYYLFYTFLGFSAASLALFWAVILKESS